MPNITVSIPTELKEKMDTLQELNWSNIVRSFLSEKVQRALLLKKLDNALASSELTEKECLTLGDKIKKNMLKRYKGW